jgi:hypothetical protein
MRCFLHAVSLTTVWLAVALPVLTGPARAGEVPRYVRVSAALGPGDIARLGAAGIPLEETRRRDPNRIEMILAPAEAARLRDLGFQLLVLDDDVPRTYAGRARDDVRKFSLQASQSVRHFHLGSMGGFLTLAELDTELDSMRAAYPSLISLRELLGFSVEQRPLWALKISRNPDVDEQEPRVLYTAVHHAREPQGMMTLLHTMWYLLERYGIDEEVTEILDHRELYFVPMVNPDGYAYNQSTDPSGGGLWRKNRSKNADGSYGVDLNRNYGIAWGNDNVGSSDIPVFDTYRGTGPFSEPETAALRGLCIRKQFSAAFNYHAYGNVLIHPWGHRNAQTPDSMVYRRLAGILTRGSYFAWGTSVETINYATNGDSDDWMYGDTLAKPVIFAMTPEVGGEDDGFWPSPGRIAPLAELNLQANLSLARLGGENFEVEIASVHQKQDNDTVSLSLALRSVGLQHPSAGVTAQVKDSKARLVLPSSAFVSTSSGLLPVRILRDRGDQEGSWMDLGVHIASAAGRSRDSVRFRVGVPTIALQDTVDAAGGKWSAASTLSGSHWDTSSAWAYSGRLSYTDSPVGKYRAGLTSFFTLNNPISIAGSAAELRFRSRWEIEPENDFAVVEASADHGQSWVPLGGLYTRPGSGAVGGKQVAGVPGFDRTQRTWIEEIMDLQPYLGGEVLLRFRLETDGFVQKDGIFVDDIRLLLYGQTALAVRGETTPLVTRLFQNYPNPFNGQTQIRFTLGSRGPVAEGKRNVTLTVYDLLGREVSTIAHGLFSPGEHVVEFDARRLASGVYWYRLQDGAAAATRSMILLR